MQSIGANICYFILFDFFLHELFKEEPDYIYRNRNL